MKEKEEEEEEEEQEEDEEEEEEEYFVGGKCEECVLWEEVKDSTLWGKGGRYEYVVRGREGMCCRR